jgi:phosphoserine aminotransferase
MSAKRPYNFSAGPAILPPAVFEQTAASVRKLAWPGDDALESQLSILEISHRSPTFERIRAEVVDLVHDVLGVPRTHEVLFLQGGASLQFAMVPMNLLGEGETAAYTDTGMWANKAIKEAKLFGNVKIVASSKDANYAFIPKDFTVPALRVKNRFATEEIEIPYPHQTHVPFRGKAMPWEAESSD